MALASSCAASAFAQTHTFSVTASTGIFVPASRLVDEAAIFDPRTADETIILRHRVGPTLGLRAARALSPRLAIEAAVLLALSDVELSSTTSEDDPGVTRDARVFVLGANVRYELFRAPFTPLSVHVVGGAALVTRGGELFDEGIGELAELEGGTDIGAIVGGGLRYGLDPRITLRLDVQDHIYSYAQSLDDSELDARIQNDVWLITGLEIGL